MDISTLGTVVGIVAICYVIGLGCKAYEKIPDKWIPVIMAVSGGVLGVAGLYTMPDFPAGDVINAVAVGMASGLAATGVNQLYKQQCKQRANNRPLIIYVRRRTEGRLIMEDKKNMEVATDQNEGFEYDEGIEPTPEEIEAAKKLAEQEA